MRLAPSMFAVTALLAALCARSAAQTPAGPLVGDAREVFERLTKVAPVALLGDAALGIRTWESLAAEHHLSRTGGQTAFGVSYGEWQASNDSGWVGLKATYQYALDKQRNYCFINFSPRVESPMPAAVLSHLLTVAAKTAIVGADNLEITLLGKLDALGCRQEQTLRVGVTTGALVSSNFEMSCPVSADGGTPRK